jgi:hypothetical protein
MSDFMSIEDSDKWLKFILICKPTQSGKTFVMIQQMIEEYLLIQDYLSEPIEDKEIVNFILCDNNLLLTKQTSSRVEKELKKYIHHGNVYIELSSHERTDYHDNASVFKAVVAENARNIICCTNGRRMDDIFELIKNLNTSPFTSGKFHFNIWLDEADKFIKFIETTLRPIVDLHTNVNVKLMTATSEPLFKKYKYMNVLPIENTTSELYHGWSNYYRCQSEECSFQECKYIQASHSHYINNIKIIEKEGSYSDFIEHILTNVASHEIKPGSKWFIPGVTAKKSHEAIKTICIEKGMAVLCVNGDGLILTLPRTLERIPYKKDDDFNSKLKDIYRYNQLYRFPFVITGYICIERGVTIISEEFMLDFAILSHCSNKEGVSQIAGRMTGNIKGFKSYNPKKLPVIFTTENFNKIAFEQEKKSRILGKLAFDKKLNGELTVINMNEYNTCDKPYKYICHPDLFDSFEDSKKFLITKQRDMDCKIKAVKKQVIHECDGYFVTSKLLAPGKTIADLTKDDRITYEKAKSISESRCISKTDKGSRYLILPLYENENTLPKNVKFQVRYIKFN